MTRTHIVPAGSMNFETKPTTETPAPTEPSPLNKNFLDYVLNNPTMLTDEFILIGTKLVNQFTNKVAFWLDVHEAQQQRRGLEPDVVGKPSLDERNEQDENARGKDLHDELTDMSGFEVQLTPYAKAETYEGLRQLLYSRINDATGNKLPNPDDVLLFGEMPVNGFISLERACRSNIDFAGQVTDNRKAQLKTENAGFGASEEVYLKRAAELATKKKENMLERFNSVMAEAKSFDTFGNEEDWMQLPRNERDSIVQRVLNNITLALAKDNPRGLRTRGTLAFTPAEKQRLRDEIVIHEIAAKRISLWVDEHCVPDEAAMLRSKAIAEAAKKMGIDTGSSIADMKDDLPH